VDVIVAQAGKAVAELLRGVTGESAKAHQVTVRLCDPHAEILREMQRRRGAEEAQAGEGLDRVLVKASNQLLGSYSAEVSSEAEDGVYLTPVPEHL